MGKVLSHLFEGTYANGEFVREGRPCRDHSEAAICFSYVPTQLVFKGTKITTGHWIFTIFSGGLLGKWKILSPGVSGAPFLQRFSPGGGGFYLEFRGQPSAFRSWGDCSAGELAKRTCALFCSSHGSINDLFSAPRFPSWLLSLQCVRCVGATSPSRGPPVGNITFSGHSKR